MKCKLIHVIVLLFDSEHSIVSVMQVSKVVWETGIALR